MAEKNLHDIKIDELGSSKKTPLKNILTLLALLFIILVISVFITRLILNTDEGSTLEKNSSTSEVLPNLTENNKTADKKDATTNSSTHDKKSEESKNDNKKSDSKDTTNNSSKAPIANSNVVERNLTSAIKTPLTSHEPKVMRTYKEPKKNTTPTKSSTSHESTSTPKKTAASHTTTTHPKKEYIDKVVAKKHTTSTSNTSSSSKHASYLGGLQKETTNSYYIKVGTYRDASTVIRKIKKNHFNYALVKVENDKSLTRVLVGPFFSRSQANGQLTKVKANILTGAYVTKVQ